jgi:hypothetical protein
MRVGQLCTSCACAVLTQWLVPWFARALRELRGGCACVSAVHELRVCGTGLCSSSDCATLTVGGVAGVCSIHPLRRLGGYYYYPIASPSPKAAGCCCRLPAATATASVAVVRAERVRPACGPPTLRYIAMILAMISLTMSPATSAVLGGHDALERT